MGSRLQDDAAEIRSQFYLAYTNAGLLARMPDDNKAFSETDKSQVEFAILSQLDSLMEIHAELITEDQTWLQSVLHNLRRRAERKFSGDLHTY